MFRLIQDELARVESAMCSVIHSRVDLLTDIGDHLIEAGGKRLRPALYLLCTKCGEADRQQTLPIAMAIELIHMATLVHDDVIDNAEIRRGVPTASACWGNHTAVLAGDYLFAKAFSVVAALGKNDVLKILSDAVSSMCEGEIIQTHYMFNPDLTEEDYLNLIAKKTADFMAVTCQLGGMSAGLLTDEVAALRRFGYLIGMAFQITDDILDLTASAPQLGKPVDNDLRNGIFTLPLIRTLQASSQRAVLRNIISQRTFSEQDLQQCLRMIHDTDAVEYSYGLAKSYLDQARQILPLVVNGDIRAAILTVADFIELRKY